MFDFSKIDKRVWIGSALFILLCVVVLVATHLIFKPLNNHNEAKYGTVSIRLSTEWPSMYRGWATEALPELNRLGPTFNIVQNNINSILVREADLQPCTTNGVGLAHLPETPGSLCVIDIDPTCTTSSLEFRTVFMHEVGHCVGLTHICRHDELRECSVVGHGLAVMNPDVRYGDGSIPADTSEADLGQVPIYEFQDLDVREFIRTHTATTTNTTTITHH
jgi:hypothetical protein